MTTMDVTKTLVIGLGSTGTRVCNNLIRRLDWQYGSAKRAPWVEFMAVETNNNEPSTALRDRGDFYPIGLDARVYGQILQDPQSHRKIQLDRWADMSTLRKLKDTEGGAGNIRMVGRLTFMTDPNFSKLKLALLDRITRLRDLQASEAQMKRGSLQDGSNPMISFGSGGEIRVFVVGTLCGGTGSGLLPDFGYFLKSLPLKETEKVIGIFTLPHEHLTSVVASNADRLKKNAYHALLELNHYHQAASGTLPPIHYPDGSVASMESHPYDLPYLVAPSAPTADGEAELNELVADRIFMNIISPEADPMSRAVDAPLPDRDHQAHVFSTFGLSVVEFPAAQITEAAGKKLLFGALNEWHAFKSDRVTDLTSLVGADWHSLIPAYLQKPSEDWQKEVTAAVNSELGAAKLDFAKLDRALAALRQAVAPDGALSNQLRAQRDQVTERIYQRFSDHAHEVLLDRTRGPKVLSAEVQNLLSDLQDLHEVARANTAVSQAEAAEAWQKVETAVQRLRDEVKRVSFLNKNKGNIEAAQRDLRAGMREFARIQMESALYASIQTHRKYGEIDFGVAEHLQRLLQQVQTNLSNLDSRITAVKNKLYSDVEAKSTTLPPVNGLVLLEPRTTVQDEYRRALEAGRSSSVQHLDNLEAHHFEALIRGWSDLPGIIVPSVRQLDKTWIHAPFDPRGEHLLPAEIMNRLLSEASRPFSLILARENVVEKVMRERQVSPTMDNKLRGAAERSRPFLTLNKQRAVEGNRSPVMERQSMFIPEGTNPSEENTFKNLVSNSFALSSSKGATSADPTRTLFLEEYYRFPLRGLDQVLGQGGLHEAQCQDFPTFHTRRDVQWYGLSKREAQLLEDAAEALVVGVVMGELIVKDGLVMPWTPQGFGDRDFRRLPIKLEEAARVLARGEQDLDSYSLLGALPTLQARIDHHWKRHDLDLHSSSQAFVKQLQTRLEEFYHQGRQGQIDGWGDQAWAGEQLARFTAKHTPLHEATMLLYPPPAAKINALTLKKDQQGRWGGYAPKDGLYCYECGGLVGETIQDAARNGWRCFTNSAHYYGN
ncbi:tubulin-like doman-containing protein [Deinococcus aquaedulcis]|uniref:tubulin-like doman-containing protein n=1 Tax=Deinococcus aquaedulcis TaxID=2840455 RepID=UPI001C83254D|nr:tubulin-like doman-containing protein [Deinococcus aquaedulcis]